ncbi:MAG: glycoside hydrolase family 16 protein [Microthrixaceae bacterium]
MRHDDSGQTRWAVAASLGVLTVGVLMATGALSEPDDDSAGGRAAGQAAATAASGSDAADQWPLVFLEDFSGKALNTERWTAEFAAPSRDPSELSCATPQNVAVADGSVDLLATEGPEACPGGKNRSYGAATLRTRGKFSSAFGRFVVRAKVAPGSGVRSTVSLLPTQEPYGKDGLSGELTLLDVDGSDPSMVVGRASWAEPGCGDGCSSESASTALSDGGDGFHTFELRWSPTALIWSVDGEPFLELGEGGSARWGSAHPGTLPDGLAAPLYPAPFDGSNPMYLVLSTTVGDDWVRPPGDNPELADDNPELPAAFTVDSVRVYAPEGAADNAPSSP